MPQERESTRRTVECVQFTLRVYADGRRERVAQAMLETERGLVEVRQPTTNQWDAMRPLLAAGLDEIVETTRPPRRVVIDERVARMRAQRR